jgi:predicted O-linked N-acetylglucosamine transferase (SPINDLY family)
MNHHFFAASAATYALTNDERDLQALLKLMDKERLAYNLYLVPVPHDTEYQINWYRPQVEGTMHLGTFNFKQRKA